MFGWNGLGRKEGRGRGGVKGMGRMKGRGDGIGEAIDVRSLCGHLCN